MRIAAVDIRPCLQGLRDPEWKFARAVVPRLEGHVLVLTDEAGERSRVITLWETAEDELRARESRGAMRDRVAATVGMTVVGMDVCGVPVLELVY